MKRLFLFSLISIHASLFSLPAFPGAEGFGAETPGGRGGQVIAVTNLNASGPGSFKAAMLTPGPRTIVFRVSGVIDLGDAQYENISLGPDNLSFLTVAGQTSPGGITLTSPSGTPIATRYTDTRFHDMVLRFIRTRLIRETGGNGGDQAFGQYMSYNFILDHCDFSGGDDEVFDIGYSRNWTVQWCTMSNSGPGGQQYGPLIAYTNPAGGYPLSRMTLHHNLIANHNKRGPEFGFFDNIPDSGKVDLRSNIMYQVLIYGCAFWGVSAASFLQLNLAGNVFRIGPQEDAYNMKVRAEPGVRVYVKDNFWDTSPEGKQEIVRRNGTQSFVPNDPDTVLDGYSVRPVVISNPWNFPPVTTHSARDFGANGTFNVVLNKVGAFPRDSMNHRTVNQVRTRTGGLGECYDPLITTGPAAPADADLDGMPDFWETGMGFNSNSASDNSGDHDGDGYTNIEEYINDLALARLCQDYYNPVYPIPNNWSDYNPSCAKPLSAESQIRLNSGDGVLSVGPNPSTAGAVNILLSVAGPLKGLVRIQDAAGRRMASFPASTRNSWSVSLVPAGVYFVRWAEGGKLLAQKRIVIIH